MKSAIFLLAVVATAVAAPSLSKVNPALLRSLKTNSRPNIIVSLTRTDSILASVSSDAASMTHGQRATAVYTALKAHADASQASVLAMLNSPRFFSFHVQSFWISNQILVEGADAATIKALAAMNEVVRIDEETVIRLDDPVTSDKPSIQNEWGLVKIRVEEAWALGGKGAGVVVGIIDTGARHTHEAIRDNFRGGTHSWFDAFLGSQDPRDGQGHGTHVTGTIVGNNGIGVAPEAQWISCKGLNNLGIATQRSLLRCGQFMTCPTDYQEANPDCTLAPHVVSNSWGSAGNNGFYDDVINAWHAAGIIPVFAAGNSGDSCSTIGSPADSKAGAIAVGATTSDDAIAEFSSRGPSSFAEAHKPDISAPGQDIRSAGIASDSEYVTFSGTSMACPHVAGLVALLKAQDLTADYNKIHSILTTTAQRELTFGDKGCDGISETEFPNYSFGHGRIDALAAVQAIKGF